MKTMQNERTYKIGIIGCGAIAQMMHMPYIQDTSGIELYALCDVSHTVLEGCGEKYKIPPQRRFLDFREMLDTVELDLAVISTMDHYAPSLAASRAGVNQLIEKPIAFNLRQANEMIDQARRTGMFQIIGFMKRYDPNFLFFADRVKQIKDIRYVRAHNFGGNMDITGKIYDLFTPDDITHCILNKTREEMEAAMREVVGGNEKLYGAYFNLLMGATHDFSLLRAMFGEPRRVDYVCASSVVTAVLRYEGVQCVFEGGWLDKRMIWDEELSVYSDGCNISIRFPWPYLKNAPSVVHINETNADGANAQKQVVVSFDEAYRREWRHIRDCLEGAAEPLTAAADARDDLALFEQMIKCAE